MEIAPKAGNEFRIDGITGTVVLIAPKRGKRPTDYLDKKPEVVSDTKCPFCPGNEKETTATISFKGESADKWTVRNFENKFAALDKEAQFKLSKKIPFGLSSPGFGRHEVIVETKRHGAGVWDLSKEELSEVFSLFSERFSAISGAKGMKSVLLFQNYGRDAGASLSHLHAQIAGFPIVLPGIEKRLKGSRKGGKCAYCGIVKSELKAKERIVLETDEFLVIAPWASVFKYETMILPKKHMKVFPEPGKIAEVFSKLFPAYRKLLGDFPYNYVVFAHPKGNLHWHILVMPKLAIHAGIEKAGGVYINSTLPEDAAQELRETIVEGDFPKDQSSP